MKIKQVIVKKIVMYTNKFQKQPLLRYRKNIQFFCSTCSIILMRLHVMNKYESVFFKVRALKTSSKLLNEFIFWTFDVVLSNFSWYVGYWKNTSFTYDSFQQLLKFLVEVAIQFLKETSNNVATLSRNYTITCYFSVCSLVAL